MVVNLRAPILIGSVLKTLTKTNIQQLVFVACSSLPIPSGFTQQSCCLTARSLPRALILYRNRDLGKMEMVGAKESYEKNGKRTFIPSWKDDSPWVKHDDRSRNMHCVVSCLLLSKAGHGGGDHSLKAVRAQGGRDRVGTKERRIPALPHYGLF